MPDEPTSTPPDPETPVQDETARVRRRRRVPAPRRPHAAWPQAPPRLAPEQACVGAAHRGAGGGAGVACSRSTSGPSLRGLAEREGSKRLQRPLHIGGLSVRLLRGEFIVEQAAHRGPDAVRRPVLRRRADHRSACRGGRSSSVSSSIQDVSMSDWTMNIEQFPGGRHNFPKLTLPQVRRQEALRHHRAPVHGHARPRPLHRLRHALERRRAQPRDQHREERQVPGHGEVP